MRRESSAEKKRRMELQAERRGHDSAVIARGEEIIVDALRSLIADDVLDVTPGVLASWREMRKAEVMKEKRHAVIRMALSKPEAA